MLDWLLNFLFPPRCIFCNKLITPQTRTDLCPGCFSQLPFSKDGIMKTKCRYIDGLISLFTYTGPVRESIVRFKFFGKPSYFRTYAKLLSERIVENVDKDKMDCIISVPLHKKRQLERGYNQSALVSCKIARILGIPDCSDLVKRVINTQKQSLLPGDERSRNVKNAFKVIYPEKVAGRNILLLDDIFTTGHTIDECARVLKEAGAKSVIGVVIACAFRNTLCRMNTSVY